MSAPSAEGSGPTQGTNLPLSSTDATRLAQTLAPNLVDVRQPLVLIAQPNRSGGTLLSQLFDGHPQLHAHPWELEIGNKFESWPALDLTGDPEAWSAELYERHMTRAYREGYSKDKASVQQGHNEPERFPFMLSPRLYRALFENLASERLVETQRDLLDIHFTSYFNAWLDNCNLDAPSKRWVIGFRGRMRRPEILVQFFRDYPDGRHITMLRQAKGNIASRLRYRPRQDPAVAADKAVRAWRRATELQLEVKRRYGDRVFMLTYERLVTDTTGTMGALARWLGIDFDPILVEPTFNRAPIRASSTFPVARHGVLTEPLEHWRQVLDKAQAESIDAQTADLYERFSAHAGDDYHGAA
jgi:hypothetical protein